MRRVQYGSRTIEYSTLEKQELKSHYITVEKDSGVVLKGKPVAPDTADQMILKKAPWILDKLKAVGAVTETEIVTGSRLPYLGKNYYTEVITDHQIEKVVMEFTYSKFRIRCKPSTDQEEIQSAVEEFYRVKAQEKITPRVEKIAAQTRLLYKHLSFRKLKKRWGSCTADNHIILNTDAVKLPFSLIDYLIVHELCHTKVKDHSKKFWAELSRHTPKWRELDEKMKGLKY